MYEEGEYPKDLKELEAKITLAEEEKQRAKQKYEGSKVLFEEKYISETELQADGLAAISSSMSWARVAWESSIWPSRPNQSNARLPCL